VARTARIEKPRKGTRAYKDFVKYSTVYKCNARSGYASVRNGWRKTCSGVNF